MRKKFAVAVAAIGCAGALAAPTMAAAPDGAADFASGGGQVANGTVFSFGAYGQPGAATGNGYFTFGSKGARNATVDCLYVDGNSATLSGRLSSPVSGNTRFELSIRDGGPNSADDHVYMVLNKLAAPLAKCGFAKFKLGPAFTQGGITIQDNSASQAS